MLAMWHMTHLNGDLTFWFAAMARITMAFSLPFLFIPITAASYEGLPPQKTNQASALVNVARNLGGSIGVSMAQTLLAQRQQFHQSRLVENIIPSDPGFQMAFHRASEYFVHHSHTPAEAKRQALAWVGRTIVHQTTLWSYIDTFWVLAIVAAVMVPLAFIVRRVHGQPRSSHA
jgi:DHA2 family multidrug resistance protein